jgi:hypothetical protein
VLKLSFPSDTLKSKVRGGRQKPFLLTTQAQIATSTYENAKRYIFQKDWKSALIDNEKNT